MFRPLTIEEALRETFELKEYKSLEKNGLVKRSDICPVLSDVIDCENSIVVSEEFGSCSLFPLSLISICLGNLKVNKEFRSRGNGKKLLRKAIEIAKSLNAKHLVLGVKPYDNSPLNLFETVSFYESFGFQKQKETGKNLHGMKLDL